MKNFNFLVPESGGALQLMDKDANGNISLKLTEKIKVSSDTNIYRFSWPDQDKVLGLPIGQHVNFTATCNTKEHPNGQSTSRKYTPISMVT